MYTEIENDALHPSALGYTLKSTLFVYICISMSPSQPPGRLLEARDKHLRTDLEEQKLCS